MVIRFRNNSMLGIVEGDEIVPPSFDPLMEMWSVSVKRKVNPVRVVLFIAATEDRAQTYFDNLVAKRAAAKNDGIIDQSDIEP